MNSVQVAPWGSATQGEAWSFESRARGGITNINIWNGEAVDAVSFVARTPDGRLQPSPKFGGDGGQETKIELVWPREYVTAISGTYNRYHNVPDVVTFLEFTTNLGRKIGPFGQANGTAFSLTIAKGAIVGFHGRSSTRFLNAIGVFARA